MVQKNLEKLRQGAPRFMAQTRRHRPRNTICEVLFDLPLRVKLCTPCYPMTPDSLPRSHPRRDAPTHG